MRVLFQSWRTQWRREDLPFLIVQKPSGQGCRWTPDARDEHGSPLPPSKLPATPAETDQSYTGGFWRADFNSQMTVPGVHLVIADDLGAGTHPSDKDRYGQRMALVALGAVYGKKHEYCGPVNLSMSREENKIRLTFDHVGQGLVARGTEHPQGFMVAAEDRVFYWAEARIEGDTVVVWSNNVREPVAARYAWAWVSPWANLFNRDGFPALLFRTDAWPGPGPYIERK
jgi:sialate O-acetylesterase